ncbi:hypothetical protein AGIG_G9686 [Arapaima gigas]
MSAMVTWKKEGFRFYSSVECRKAGPDETSARLAAVGRAGPLQCLKKNGQRGGGRYGLALGLPAVVLSCYCFCSHGAGELLPSSCCSADETSDRLVALAEWQVDAPPPSERLQLHPPWPPEPPEQRRQMERLQGGPETGLLSAP